MEMYEDFLGFDHLYDARICTEDGFQFPVHRVLLALKSEYFHNLLCTQGKADADLLVPGIQGPTMKIIIDYLYTKRLILSGHEIREVLEAAYFLGIDPLLQNCRTLASRNLTTSNCIPLFLAAWNIEKLGILNVCTRFIVVNFENIIRDPKSRLEDLPLEPLEKILALDNLNVSNEHQIWRAITSWVNKDPLLRKPFLKCLIQYIRFQDPQDELVSEVLEHPLVLDNPCYPQLKDLISYSAQSFRYRIPNEVYFFTKMYISRIDYAEGIKLYITYDEDIDVWRNIGSKIFCPDVVLHGSGSLVMMFDTNLNVIVNFDMISKRWSQLIPPSMPRREYNVVKLGRFIYALGGILPGNEQQIITAVERYNSDSGLWEFSKPHYALSQGAAAVVDNRIYVIGIFSGFYNEVILAQRYNPSTDCWSSLNPPNIYRRQFAFVAYRGELYILGGQSNDGFLKSVEVYDTEDNTWNEFKCLPFSYFLPKAVVIKDTLYVYDNHSDDYIDYRSPPVLWDGINKNWHIVEIASPYRDLHIYQFCVIDDYEVIKRMRHENRNPSTKWYESPFFLHL